MRLNPLGINNRGVTVGVFAPGRADHHLGFTSQMVQVAVQLLQSDTPARV